jgi:hypothetical protein
MTFRFNKNNATKAKFRTQVSRKHKAFKRFKKRFNTTNSTSVKTFCKREAAKIVKQLKTFARQYKNFGFGGTSWITTGYNMTSFTSGNNNRKTRRTTKRTYARRTSKSYGRRTRTWARGRKSRTTNRNRNRKSYVAW